MRKAFYIILVLVTATVGFRFGRSGSADSAPVEAVSAAGRSYPLPPPPPESQPYVPGGEPTVVSDGTLVFIESPVDGAEVRGSFDVSGRARVEFGVLKIAIIGRDGQELFSRKVSLSSEGEGAEYGRFVATVGDLGMSGEVAVRVTAEGIEGAVAERTAIIKSERIVSARIFFSNAGMDPWQSCEKTFPVGRDISSDGTVFRSALEMLFAGPTEEERRAGYTTALPDGVKLKSVAADSSGIVTADFTRHLERGVEGACRVSAIRAQIEETLKQFPEVRGVIITVEGAKDGVLMP